MRATAAEKNSERGAVVAVAVDVADGTVVVLMSTLRW
jgi:hypothetical protein